MGLEYLVVILHEEYLLVYTIVNKHVVTVNNKYLDYTPGTSTPREDSNILQI